MSALNQTVAAKLAKRQARKAFRADNREFIAATSRKKAKKAKRPKSLSNSKLEALRWEAFAAMIRERDQENGCFVCKTAPVEQAGHTIPRGRAATKYNEENVHGWCEKCNLMDHKTKGYHDWAVLQHIARYSPDHYLSLVTASREIFQESRQDIIVSAWEYMNRMTDGERKDKIRKKLSPLVPVEHGGTKAE